jgi:periplasmic mercuric ion binding protein
MRLLALSLMTLCALTLGCNQPTESLPNVSPSSTSGTTDDHGHSHAEGEDHDHGDHAEPAEAPAAEAPAEESASVPTPVRFVSDKSMKVEGMHCPYSCYPTVEAALAKVAGVEAVQLAAQPEGTPEGQIANPVVELKLADGFDADAAIAALKAVSFEGELLN